MFDAAFYTAWDLGGIGRPNEGGIYVHVPFCARRCRYCAFVSSVWREVPSDAFAQGIERELDARAAECGFSRIKTLYFGGGTPTMLHDDAIEAITAHCVRRFGVPQETTLEANPEHVTRERAERWKSLGVTRVSLGVQSFDDAMLRLLGRHHDARRAVDAVDAIRAAGIAEVSIDLIYGGDTGTPDPLSRWAQDLAVARQICPEHVSCYELTIEPHTPLWTMQRRGTRVHCDDDAAVEMMAMIPDALGMRQYEVSNYSRPGYFSAHNVSCWGGLAYLGLGPGAHSMRRCGAHFVRRANASDVRAWVAAGSDVPPEFEETLDARTHLGERLMCAARTRFWWSPDEIALDVGCTNDGHRDALEKAVRRGLLERNGDRYRTTDDGIRLNNILDEILWD